jgi:hypothetical protein
MKKKYILIKILLSVIGIILVTACVDQINMGNETLPIPTSANCSKQNNAEPFITINPVTTHTVGDVFDINGITNLGVNSKIVLNFYELRGFELAPAPNATSTPYYEYSGTSGFVNIQNGTCGTNFWSFSVNVSEFHSGRYYSINIWDESNHSVNNWTQSRFYFDELENFGGK